jgi:hypothetical protein
LYGILKGIRPFISREAERESAMEAAVEDALGIEE